MTDEKTVRFDPKAIPGDVVVVAIELAAKQTGKKKDADSWCDAVGERAHRILAKTYGIE